MTSAIQTRQTRRKRQRRNGRIKKMIIFVVIVGILATGGMVFANHLFSKVHTEDTKPYLENSYRPVKVQPSITYNKPVDRFSGPLNILLVGSDTRKDDPAAADASMRSDSVIVAHISADRKRVDMISIPRDLMVDIPSCSLPDGSQTAPERAKFNAAFSNGGQTGDIAAAAACTIKTIESLTDVFIDGFAVIDFNGFEKVIDSLGGVEFDVKEKIVDPDFENLTIEAGVQTFDGKTALNYARVRKAVGMDGSDIARIGRQHELISAIINKTTASMTDIPAMYKVVNSIADMTTLSTEIASFSDLTGLAWALKDINHENINFITTPFVDAGDGANVLWDVRANQLWQDVKYDTPITQSFIESIAKPVPAVINQPAKPCPVSNTSPRCPMFME